MVQVVVASAQRRRQHGEAALARRPAAGGDAGDRREPRPEAPDRRAGRAGHAKAVRPRAAGCRTGDLIVRIDGQEIEDPNAFDYRFATKPLGGTAQLGVAARRPRDDADGGAADGARAAARGDHHRVRARRSRARRSPISRLRSPTSCGSIRRPKAWSIARYRQRLAGAAARLPARRRGAHGQQSEDRRAPRDLERADRAARAGSGGSPSVRGGQQMSVEIRADDARARPKRRRRRDLFAAAGARSRRAAAAGRQAAPAKLAEVVGQDHLLGPDGALTRMLATRTLGSLVFWGPPGTGKTTVARLLAEATDLHFEQISAIFTGVADLKKVFERRARGARPGRGRCCSSTRSTASTARSRTRSCR